MSQGFEVRTYVEQTIVGTKVGTAIGRETKASYRTPLSWEYGGFYQEAVDLSNAPVNEVDKEAATVYEKEFFGLYGGVVLRDGNFINVRFNVRTGVTNRENFAITPSVLGQVKVLRSVRIGGGLGIRSFRPTYQGSITVVL